VRPEVSVVIPVLNAAGLLPDAIASVREQAIASEIVVVDDGSTDETHEVAERLADVVVAGPGRGVAAARNAGLSVAGASFVAFIDADDVWASGKLRLQRHVLESSEAAVALGHTVVRARRGDGWVEHPKPHLMLQLGAALIRREVFERVGSFDEALRYSEDVDWFLRVRDSDRPVRVHPDVVQYIRRHGANMTRRLDMRALGFLEVLKRSLDRRRGRGTESPWGR
jgi:glycosyltransferase involved in cell wall biosynthesis